MSKFVKKIKDIAEGLRAIVRGYQGLPIDEDKFSGLLDIKDIRERTRLNTRQIFGHSYMRLLHAVGGEEWEIMRDTANMQDHYFISKDGEQRKEAILLTRAKSEVRLSTGEPLTIPPVETKPPPPEKKKHFWNRSKKD